MHSFTPALSRYFARGTVAPIGRRRDGRPIFPIAGGAENEPPEGGDGGGNEPPKPDEFTPPASQEEFDRMIGPRLKREREKFADYSTLKEKADAHDKAMADAQTEQEKAVEAARKEGRDEVQSAANSRLIAAEARAVAATARFRNPSAAVKLADLSDVTIGDNGEVDAKALKTALDALAESDPYLIDAGDGKPPRPKPDGSQGGRSSGDRPTSVTAVMEERRQAREAKSGT